MEAGILNYRSFVVIVLKQWDNKSWQGMQLSRAGVEHEILTALNLLRLKRN